MRLKRIIVIGIAFILLPIALNGSNVSFENTKTNTEAITEREDAMPVVVSKENPFYALIATPVALYYEGTEQHVMPLLVENFSNPSSSIKRFEEMYGLKNAIIIKDEDIVNASISLATQIWHESSEAIIIKNDFDGYSIGINLAPLSTYKDIPIFVADDVNQILPALKQLGVKTTYTCGNIDGYGKVIGFRNEETAYEYIMEFVKEKFGNVGYVVMSNPLDITKPEVMESVEYEFNNTIPSVAILPAQSMYVAGQALTGKELFGIHEFEIPDYKYARVKVDLINLDSENVKELGDGIFLMITNPEGRIYVYTATGAGIPEMDENGDIVTDRVHYEFIVGNEPGKYTARVIGRWFADVKGSYTLKIKVESIDTPIDPLMEGLSSLAPYLASYHKGMVFAKEDFAFAGNKGMSQPGDNPDIKEECNRHVREIHKELNALLTDMAGLPNDLYILWNHYRDNPIYIAIMADATMIPMYYFKKS